MVPFLERLKEKILTTWGLGQAIGEVRASLRVENRGSWRDRGFQNQ